jgi:hypothetical protein
MVILATAVLEFVKRGSVYHLAVYIVWLLLPHVPAVLCMMPAVSWRTLQMQRWLANKKTEATLACKQKARSTCVILLAC